MKTGLLYHMAHVIWEYRSSGFAIFGSHNLNGTIKFDIND